MTLAFWIEYPSEPRELLLVWQAPPSAKDRLRWAVGRLRKVGGQAVFEYLEGDDFVAQNIGRSPEDLWAAGFSDYPALKIKKQPQGGFREGSLEAFLRRVPSATRPDFSSYLAHYHLHQTTPLSPFALLAATEARLPSDGFSLVDPLEPEAVRCDLMLEIAGYRHYATGGIHLVKVGDEVEIEPEPDNAFDPQAVQILAGGRQIGHINRLQSPTFLRWLAERHVTGHVERLSGNTENLRAYIFVRVRPLSPRVAA